MYVCLCVILDNDNPTVTIKKYLQQYNPTQLYDMVTLTQQGFNEGHLVRLQN